MQKYKNFNKNFKNATKISGQPKRKKNQKSFGRTQQLIQNMQQFEKIQ